MKMHEIVLLATQFASEQSDGNVKVEFSTKPWRPRPDLTAVIEHNSRRGIYVYCDVGADVPAGLSEADVWYIGMADGSSIAGRVWNHLGVMTDQVTREALPRFVNHRWNEMPGISKNYRDAITDRNFDVFTAAVCGDSGNLARELESFLLNTIYKRENKLPPLNTQLPR